MTTQIYLCQPCAGHSHSGSTTECYSTRYAARSARRRLRGPQGLGVKPGIERLTDLVDSIAARFLCLQGHHLISVQTSGLELRGVRNAITSYVHFLSHVQRTAATPRNAGTQLPST